MIKIITLVLIFCLAMATMEDIRSCEVHNLIWWPVVICFAVYVVANGYRNSAGMALSVCVFSAIQLLLFGRWYGRADCYGFCSCAFCLALYGCRMREYLIHMSLSLLFLFIDQARRHNIAWRQGNLKTPVAFLPYITLAFLCMLWYHIIW